MKEQIAFVDERHLPCFLRRFENFADDFERPDLEILLGLVGSDFRLLGGQVLGIGRPHAQIVNHLSDVVIRHRDDVVQGWRLDLGWMDE